MCQNNIFSFYCHSNLIDYQFASFLLYCLFQSLCEWLWIVNLSRLLQTYRVQQHNICLTSSLQVREKCNELAGMHVREREREREVLVYKSLRSTWMKVFPFHISILEHLHQSLNPSCVFVASCLFSCITQLSYVVAYLFSYACGCCCYVMWLKAQKLAPRRNRCGTTPTLRALWALASMVGHFRRASSRPPAIASKA